MRNPLHIPKKPRSVRAAVFAGCLAGLIGWAGGAWAALGQPLSSNTSTSTGNANAATAAARLSATTTSQSGLYVVLSSTLESGTVVTEYATPAGLVFAVAWRGPVLPELDALLGNYFSTFKTLADASRMTRSLGAPLRIDTPDLVVRSGGRMRNFSGNAYAPGLLPTGVRIRDVLP